MFMKAMFLFVSMVFVISCGGEKTSSENTSNKISGKIVVGGWPAADTGFEAALPGFYEMYPDVEVEVQMSQTADYQQALTVSLSAGTGAPDVAMLEGGFVGQFKDSAVLENLLAAPYNAGELEDDFVDYKWSVGFSLDRKKMTALPWDIGPVSLFYRRDIFEAVGLPSEPEEVEKFLATWEGFLEVCRKVSIPNERWAVINAFYIPTWSNLNRDYYDKDVNFDIDKQLFLEEVEVAKIIRDNGWDAQVADMYMNEAISLISSGKIVMVVGGCWYGGFLKSWVAPDTLGKWGIVRLPGGIENANSGGSFFAIPSQSKNKEAAWAFIEYMAATKEGQNTIFEAVDYFPAYKPAWDDAMYNEPDPYFADQNTRALWVDVAKNIKPVRLPTIMDSIVEGSINIAVNLGLSEGKSPEEIYEMVLKQVDDSTKIERAKFKRMKEAASK